MAILESCCGCSLSISSAVLGVYLLVAYAIAFAVELWWILESLVAPPIPAYLLCLVYFILFAFAALLLHGLSVKNTTFLLVWLFMMGILLGPEAGLVLYLSIHYWRVTSLYGLIEITCWACRLVVNSIGLLCVQSLHSTWREEKSLLLRLETLKASPLANSQGRTFNAPSMFGYKNPESEKNNSSIKKAAEIPNTDFPSKDSKDEEADWSYVNSRYAECSPFSEFNASTFNPTVIDARLENLPYLTIRKKPKPLMTDTWESVFREKKNYPKTRSLIDLRETEDQEDTKRKKLNSSSSKENNKFYSTKENNTNSLDRKIIKNKNLKILKKLSPFYSRKPVEVNIYNVNPSKMNGDSSLDSKLNKVYSNRGMYAFDEKSKKVVFYPPEHFEKSNKFRNRMDSYSSNQSRSSVETDSEDIRHIGDVAL